MTSGNANQVFNENTPAYLHDRSYSNQEIESREARRHGASTTNFTSNSSRSRHDAPPLQIIIEYSSVSRGNKQSKSARTIYPYTLPNQSTQPTDEQASRRYARVWDPIEVTDALQTFATGDYNRHPRTAKYPNTHRTPGQDSSYHTRDHNRNRSPKFAIGAATSASTPSPQSHPTTPALPEGIYVHDTAPTCLICLDNTNRYPRSGPTSRCTHAPNVCGQCLEQHLSYSILTNGLTSITCPVPECRQTFRKEDVVRVLKKNQSCLRRYEKLLVRKEHENDPNFVWCKSPTCSWGQVHKTGAKNPLVVCEECNARSCFTHDIPWHSGLTCKEFDANSKPPTLKSYLRKKIRDRRETRESEKFIRDNTQKCPNPSCGRQIQKNGGCNHMTCRRPAGCGHEFCWLCLADYTLICRDGSWRHKPDCPNYTGPPAPVPMLVRPRS